MNNAKALQSLLDAPGIIPMPGVFDPVSTRLAERAGFEAAFMSGFMVAAARIGMPDTGLISYTEMLDQGRNLVDAVSIPVIGDGDTGQHAEDHDGDSAKSPAKCARDVVREKCRQCETSAGGGVGRHYEERCRRVDVAADIARCNERETQADQSSARFFGQLDEASHQGR